jgi:hypothetical protein|tara:strand:+ start:482 stop:835 length:354 start_codon:yes stop_codon:yes gene_type:complete
VKNNEVLALQNKKKSGESKPRPKAQLSRKPSSADEEEGENLKGFWKMFWENVKKNAFRKPRGMFDWVIILFLLLIILGQIPSTRDYIDNTFIPFVDNFFENADLEKSLFETMVDSDK